MSVAELQPVGGSDFGRTPPQDVYAEQCVVGGMLLSKDAIADVVEVLRPGDFYRPAHQVLFDVIIDLYGRGEPADAVTVAAELTKRGEIARVGGADYLHTVMALVPVAANAGYYARIVHERAILRRLVEAGSRITQMGYAADAEVDDIVDRAQAEVYAITERRTGDDYLRLSEVLPATLDEIEAIGSRGGAIFGVPTGFSELDQLTNGLHPGQMVILAARPAIGKSTLALDLVRSASVKHGLASVIFSLEMSRSEITMRLLSAEAKVALHAIRSGTLSDDDWTRLARRMSEVSEAPLYIDDSPNLTMMEIRAKARRLKQQHDLRMVVVDYMQLMQSPRRVESRQQEVSEISRSMKLLAKELDVPVLAISQLNRGPEQRNDKKPQLSDLRESGCLTAGTRLLRADTGAEVSFGDLLTSGERDVPVWSLDDRLKLVPRILTHAFPSGTREVFRMRLASGREVQATENHRFLTRDGWCPLGDLGPGVRIGVPRSVPEPLNVRRLPEARIVMLAHLLGDGSFVKRQPPRYAGVDEANLRAVNEVARNPEKFVPPVVFSLPTEQIELFIRHLWATDGFVRWDAKVGQARIYYASTSRRLVDDLSRLLLRCGILSRIARVHKAGYQDGFHLLVYGAENQLQFLEAIGVHGARNVQAEQARRALRKVNGNTNVDTVPAEVWERVRLVLHDRQLTHRESAAAMGTRFCGSTMWRHAPSRARLARVVMVLDDADLDVLATNDVFWDSVVAVESLGEQPVYDATVLGTHNFVAGGIAAHNSLEQDADMVILLNREDAYERESPRAGEADLIVAKHRNGPTKTVTVAFQGHYSRFVDMAPA